MKSLLAFRRALTAAGLLLTFFLAVPSALATHLRGGTLSWKVISTSGGNYTVQFTLTESQRWSYTTTATTNPGLCSTAATKPTGACLPLNSSVTLAAYTNAATGFVFGDGSPNANPTGTITSINQAQDYATATFVFTHQYAPSPTPWTAYFYAVNRISTLKIGGNEPEYISTTVQNYTNGTPVASEPAILSVPLKNSTGFNLGSAVNDIDPNANLVFRLATFTEMFGPASINGNLSAVPCPISTVLYKPGGVASGNPPGFTISAAGVVTWDTTQIASSLSGGNCGFGTPAAGDLWEAQIMVEAHDRTTNALISQVPVDLLMQFVSPVGVLPTVTLNPLGPQTINIGTPVTFTATGNSSNAGATITLNASGVPPGASATGLNATVTPPTSSIFSWTPDATQAGTYVVTYTVTDSNLQQAQASETIIVATLPTITCSTGINVPYGSSGTLSATVYDPSNELLNVVWTLDGTTVQTDNGVVAYPTAANDQLSQNFGTVGIHNATATATDPHGVAVSCNTTATVVPADQTITFGALSNVTYGAPDFTLTATATSGLAVAYAPAGSCSITGSGNVHITGAGSCQITASQAGNTSYNTAPNVIQSFTINPAAVTATGGSGTAQYDGTVKTPSACAVTGSYIGDLTCTNQPASVGPDVSTTAIVPSVTGSNLSSFTVTAVNGSYSITQAPSVTTLNCPTSVTYNGAAQTPCTATVSGVGGLNQSVTVTYSSNLNAGTATANAIYAGDTDHTASSGSTTFSIAPALLTVTAGSYSGVYDGSAHALSTCKVSSNFDGLTCSNNPAGPVGPDAGSATVTPVISGSTANYIVTAVNGSWSITALPVTVTAGSYSAVYDGNVHATSACTTTYAGVTCANSPASVGPGVGSGAVYSIATLVSGIAADYAIALQGGTWSITQATSTTSIVCPTSVTYNGSAQTPCTATATGAGGLNQTIPVTYGGNINTGVVSVSATFGGDSNHLGSTNSTTFTITPATLTFSAGSYSGMYDGNTHALTACVISSNPSGLTCSNNPVGPVGPDVGSGVVAPVASGSTSNYSVTSNNGSWSITPRPVTITAGSYNGAYDGSAHTPSSCTSNYAGAVCANSPTSVGPAISSGTITPTTSFTTGNATDYSVTAVNGSYSITARPASITPNAATKMYGAADPTLSGTTAGFLPTDNIVVTYSRTSGQSVAGSPYTISGTVASNPALANYTVTYNTAAFTITKIPASVTPNAASKTYGTADPVLTGTLSGFLTTDGVTATYSRVSGETVAGSPYTISGTLSPASALTNYNITYNTAAFTINKATPMVTWATPAAITYGTALSGTQLNATASVGGTFAYTPSSGTLAAGTQSLSVLFTPTDSTDYKTATASVSLTVNKAATTTTIAVTTTQTVSGTTATLNATVTPQISGTPTGTITYMNGTTVLGSAAVGTPFTTAVLPVGANSITAVYYGDSNFNVSTSAKTTVTSVAPTTIQLIIPVPTVLYPLPVAYTVIVPLKNLQLITGTITIYDGNTALCTVPILPGGIIAGLTLPPLSVGTHSLRAVYSGDSHYPPGQSPVVTISVVTLFHL